MFHLDVCKFENGVLASVDFSKIYSLSRDEKRVSRPTAYAEVRDLCLITRERPGDFPGLLAPLLPALRERSDLPVLRSDLSLVPSSRPLAAASLPSLVAPSGLEQRKGEVNINLHQLPKRTYSVERAPGAHPGSAGGRVEMEVPFGMPRYVNVRTLKAMLGASSWDPLFRKAGERWKICPDSYQVDLEDRNQVYRLGKLQILS